MASIEIEQDGFQIEIEFDYEITPGDPGKYSGLWEDCYPSSPSEINNILNEEVLIDNSYETNLNYAIAIMRVKEKLANGDFYDEEFEQAAFADYELKEE